MRTMLVTAVFATIAATASAQEIVAFDDPFVSQKTRAEVIAELSAAQAQGLMQQQGELTWVPSAVKTSDHSRAVVRSAARHAESVSESGTVYAPRYRN